jgi:hypothetical protein
VSSIAVLPASLKPGVVKGTYSGPQNSDQAIS